MKIEKIETLRVLEQPNLIWVCIHTSDGIVGLGETYFGASAVEADIHDRIAPLILHQDPSRIEWLHMKMQPYVGFTGTGAEVRALSAIDVALWDIAGKRAEKPLCELLGGKTRDSIAVYNTCAGPSYVSKTSAVRPDNFGTNSTRDAQYEDLQAFLHYPEDLASSLLEMGIASMKIWPFDLAEGAKTGISISATDLKKGVEPFERIRSAHGNHMRLKAELHGLWSLQAAKDIATALADLDIDWIEDPIWMDHHKEIRELTQFTSTPIAGGETLTGLAAFNSLICDANVATPIMDITWGGGVSAANKIATLAKTHGKAIAFHDCSGPVTLAVSTHLALNLSNVREQEIARGFYFNWYNDFVTELPPISQGMITVPDGNGLGLELLPDIYSRPDVVHRVTR